MNKVARALRLLSPTGRCMTSKLSLLLITTCYWLCLLPAALANTPIPEPQASNQSKPTQQAQVAETQSSEPEIDWGMWAEAPQKQYGVGIQGDIENQINLLDKSNLLDNATGVEVKTKAVDPQPQKAKKTKNLQQMMAELKAMEAKLEKEIENETEF